MMGSMGAWSWVQCAVCLIWGAGVGACGSPQPLPAAPPSAAEPAPPQPLLPNDFTLPVARSAVFPDGDAVWIMVSQRSLFVGLPMRTILSLPPASERALGFRGAEVNANLPLYIRPLARAAKAIACEHGNAPAGAVLVFDASTPFKIIEQVDFTMELGLDDRHLAVRSPWSGRSIRVLPIQLVSRYEARADARLILDASGVAVAGKDGAALGANCRANVRSSTGTGSESVDAATLRDCIAKNRRNESWLLEVVAAPEVTYDQLVSVLDLLLGEGPTTFRRVALREPDTARSQAPQPALSDAASKIAALRSAFRACYSDELQARPDAAGIVRLTIHVGADGTVVATQTETSGDLRTTAQCVEARARQARFLPPTSGAAKILVPITFVNPGRTDPGKPCWPAE